MDVTEQLRRTLLAAPSSHGYVVAFSGGLDSQVLLHALAGLRAELSGPLSAIHVHHGLSPNADQWATLCADVCTQLDVPCRIIHVTARARPGESPEAAARAARYAAFEQVLALGQFLLTAHHQDDQAETLLLMLLRGAGPAGLAGMPLSRPLGQGSLLRPMLSLSRAQLSHYAKAHNLQWVDDESNLDTSYDRNFLRHEVLPLLRQRWPAAAATLTRAAVHQAEANTLLTELAAVDMKSLAGSRADTLSVSGLLGLRPERRRNALRHWLRQQALPLPDTAHLLRIEHEVLSARADAVPLVQWPGAEARRYRDDLYAMPPLAPVPAMVLGWDLQAPLSLPHGLGRLEAVRVVGQGISAAHCSGKTLTVTVRQGGERCQPAGRAHTHELRKLMQEAGMPPWERLRTPLLLVDGQLAEVVGQWVCAPFQAAPGEPGVLVHWLRPSEIASRDENNDNYAGPRA